MMESGYIYMGVVRSLANGEIKVYSKGTQYVFMFEFVGGGVLHYYPSTPVGFAVALDDFTAICLGLEKGCRR